jgi:hypothetical protein
MGKIPKSTLLQQKAEERRRRKAVAKEKRIASTQPRPLRAKRA